jgi:signal transduction histidine kinase/CheY-like chemotaxis protein
VEAEGVWQGELVNRRKDGSDYDALLTITAVRGRDGALLQYVGTATDISQRKQHEEELIAARDRAEAGARAKAAFLATMSHEIRTPMNGILGMIQLSLMSQPSDKVREFLGIAKSSADSLLTILNDVLDFSKAEAGYITIEKRPYNPASLVVEVADLFAARAAEKGLTLSHSASMHLPDRVTGDETRVRQVLTNLLSNAIKFTATGSADLSVTLAEEGRVLVYSIVDTGIGIAPEMQAQVFAPFSQADDSITRRYGGTGLGLAICRQLADLMGGTLKLDSTPGLGSRFTLSLPLGSAASVTPTSTPVSTQPAGPAQRSLSILVAEDMPVNQALMRALLSNEGHQVAIAVNGVAAVAIAAAQRFDVILMDMQMPEMGGLEATRRLRANEAAAFLQRVPVIALTASVFPVDRAACADAGMDDFLAKPVEVDQLRASLYRHSMGTALPA